MDARIGLCCFVFLLTISHALSAVVSSVHRTDRLGFKTGDLIKELMLEQDDTIQQLENLQIFVEKHRNEEGGQCTCADSICSCCLTTPAKWFSSACVNVSYSAEDLSMSLTVSINNVVIIKETLSASNLPPFCIGFADTKLQLCAHLYNVTFINATLHGCFRLEVGIIPFELGCFDLPVGAIQHQYIINKYNDEQETIKLIFKKMLSSP